MGTLHHQPVDVYLPSGIWSLLSLPLFHTFSGIPPRHWRGHAPSCATGFGVWSSKHRLRPFWFVGRSLSRATNRFWGSLEKLEKTLPEAEAEEESATKVYLDRRSSENSYGWSFFFPHSILYRNQSDEYIFQFFSSVAQQPEMIAPAKPCLADWTWPNWMPKFDQNRLTSHDQQISTDINRVAKVQMPHWRGCVESSNAPNFPVMVSNALVLTEWIGDITFLIRQSMIYQIDNERFFQGN